MIILIINTQFIDHVVIFLSDLCDISLYNQHEEREVCVKNILVGSVSQTVKYIKNNVSR